MILNQVRDQLVSSLAMSRVGAKAIDPVARSFSMGRVSGFEEALRILDQAIQADQVARIKTASLGKDALGGI